MAPTDTLPSRRVAEEYEGQRTYVLSVLSRRCGWLAGDEREEIFHEAYALLLEKENRGTLDVGAMEGPQLRAYLTQTAINKALDEGKRAGRNRSTPLGDTELSEPDTRRSPEDLAAASIDSGRVREIVSELPERRQAIVKLRFFYDRSPTEIQRYLGITERVYRRELERALRHLLERQQMVEDGSFCESRRSTILAYVAGIAGPSRMEAARAHLATCSACAHQVAELRETARRGAAMLPPPLFVFHDAGPLERLGNTISGAFSTLKDQLTGAAVRVDAGSAGYATAARPGAIAATLFSCVAISGGAAYCAVEGLPSFSSPPPAAAKGKDRPRPEPKASTPSVVVQPPAVEAPAATVSSAPAKTTAKPEKQQVKRSPSDSNSTKSPSPKAAAQASDEAVASEFGMESSGTAVTSESGSSSASSSSSSAPVESAPAPAPAPAPSPAPSSQASAEFLP